TLEREAALGAAQAFKNQAQQRIGDEKDQQGDQQQENDQGGIVAARAQLAGGNTQGSGTHDTGLGRRQRKWHGTILLIRGWEDGRLPASCRRAGVGCGGAALAQTPKVSRQTSVNSGSSVMICSGLGCIVLTFSMGSTPGSGGTPGISDVP